MKIIIGLLFLASLAQAAEIKDWTKKFTEVCINGHVYYVRKYNGWMGNFGYGFMAAKMTDEGKPWACVSKTKDKK